MTDEPHPGDCTRARLQLSLRADGEASPQQRREVDAHLAGCDGCRRAAAADAAVRERLAERAGAPLPAWSAGFPERTAARALAQRREALAQNRLLWAAAAAAVLVAAVAPLALGGPRGSAAPPPSPRESTRLALLVPPEPRLPGEGR